MKMIRKLALEGAAEVRLARHDDDRGWFSRWFCQNELDALNLRRPIQQINSSLTQQVGTVRGLHYQRAPFMEDKLVRCLTGRIYDVILDLRPDSPSHGQWDSIELTASDQNMLYVPKGMAHGFQTLEQDVQVLYLHTEYHSPEHEAGIAYDSPELDIPWPLKVSDLSTRDQNLPSFSTASSEHYL